MPLIRSNIGEKESQAILSRHSVSVFSQYGEDGILELIRESLNLIRPRILEFGAGEFVECNSRFLSRSRLAQAYLIDSNPNLQNQVLNSIEAKRTEIIPVVEWVTIENARVLFASACEKMGGIDILSIDLDGNYYWVLNSLDLNEVKVIVVEYNPFFGVGTLAVPYDAKATRHSRHESGDVYGASLVSYIHLLKRRGFEFLGTNEVKTNAFFVQSSSKSLFKVKFPTERDFLSLTRTSTTDKLWASGYVKILNYDLRVAAISDVSLINTVLGEEETILSHSREFT